MPTRASYKEATIQFANALKVDRNFADAHYQLSKVLIKQGSMMPAYGELMRTVDLQPNNLQARIDLGNILIAGRQAAKAAEQANAVLAIDPNNADAYALLSSIAVANGDRAEALTQIQKALAIDPNRASFPRLPRLSPEHRSHHGGRWRRPASQGRFARRQKCNGASRACLAPAEEG